MTGRSTLAPGDGQEGVRYEVTGINYPLSWFISRQGVRTWVLPLYPEPADHGAQFLGDLVQFLRRLVRGLRGL